MKRSFVNLWRRNLAFFRLAVISNLEYRLNFFADAVAQPALATFIEILLWIAIFSSVGSDTIAGFPKESYLAYVLWASFVGRVTSNWMYEFHMIEAIESGQINGMLVRPVSFFETYFSQFLGYKCATAFFSFLFQWPPLRYFSFP